MSDDPRAFRWQALFHRAADALFVLDRRRRLRFVNRAFEALTGLGADRLRGLPCRRPRASAGEALAEDVVSYLLTPPPEVLAGSFSRARRLYHDRSGRHATPPPPAWWDVEFLPLRQGEGPGGCLVLGRIVPVAAEGAPAEVMLPERLVALRQAVAGRFGFDLLQSRHAVMDRLARQVRLALATRGPALLVGEAGAGKETVARVIHHQGGDRERAFAALDCERLPPQAAAAVLLCEPSSAALAGVGTVYLRQPGGLPRELQLLLCQRLEADEPGAPRLLAGTTQPPDELVRDGRLLEELAGLLSPLTIDVPPLRRRMDDLPWIVERMLSRLNEGEPTPVAGLAPAAWELLRGHAWPGNLAELFAALAEARGRASGGRIDAGDLPMPLRLAQEPVPVPARPLPPLPELLEQVEKRLIEVALRRAGGNRSKAAEALGIYRARLLRRMEALGLGGEEG